MRLSHNGSFSYSIHEIGIPGAKGDRGPIGRGKDGRAGPQGLTGTTDVIFMLRTKQLEMLVLSSLSTFCTKSGSFLPLR